MKTLILTYDTQVYEDGRPIYGETCLEIDMADDRADLYMQFCDGKLAGRSKATSDLLADISEDIITILDAAERLKGRVFVRGSVKDVRYARDCDIPTVEV